MNNRIDPSKFAKYTKALEEESSPNELKTSGLQEHINGNGVLKKAQVMTSAFKTSRWLDKKISKNGATTYKSVNGNA